MTATECGVPAGGVVHVWRVPLDAVAPEHDLLSESERGRATRFARDEPRAAFVASRCALRRILSHYTGVAPRELVLAAGDSGKPVLPGHRRLHFNLSHSGRLALVTVAAAPVGVDVEAGGRGLDHAALAGRYFHPAERDVVARAADPAAVFLAVWTAKEAALKAAGLGLRVELSLFDVSPAALGNPCETRLPVSGGMGGDRVHVRPLAEPSGAACVASTSAVGSLHFCELL